MAGSLNKVILIGNLGADPEIRRTQDGRKIANLNIATSETWKDKNTGERQEKTEWHRIVVFNEGLCSVIENYVKKGSKVYIEGQLQTRKWQDNSGVEKYSTEIILQNYNGVLTMLDSRENNQGGGQQNQNQNQNNNQNNNMNKNNQNSNHNYNNNQNDDKTHQYGRGDIDDEIPF